MVNLILKLMFLTFFLFGVFFVSMLVHEGTHYAQYKEWGGKSICYNFGQNNWMDFRGDETKELYPYNKIEGEDFNEKVASIVQTIFYLSIIFIGGYYLGKNK